MTHPQVPPSGVSEARVRGILARLKQEDARTRFVFTEVYEASALHEAREADRRRHLGLCLGPLDGVVVSVKDLFDIRGYKTSAGSRLLATHATEALADATAVQRLRAAGGIIIGRTSMSELAFSGVGNNLYCGTPANPADPACIPGGSSAGAAVSVALGLADIGLGSDTGGSLRIPAALCGVVGFKPSSGMVPTAGTFPLSETLDTVGPITATVEGCMQAFAVLSGGCALAMPARGPYRLGIVYDGRITDGTEDAVAQALQQAKNRLEANGVLLQSMDIAPILDELAQIDARGTFPSIELAARLGTLSDADKALLDPAIWDRIRSGYHARAIDYLAMQQLRKSAIAHMQQLMQGVDAIMLATVPVVAPLAADLAEPEHFHAINSLLLRNTRIANLLNMPSISIPLPVSGKPVGLMLWGRTDADWALLHCAKEIETIVNDK